MNPNIKKRNKSLCEISNKRKQHILKNSIIKYFHPNNEYDNFQSTVSNITKQLNNMSLNAFPKVNNDNIDCSLKKDNFEVIKSKSKDMLSKITNENSLHKNKIYSSHSNSLINKENLLIINNNSFCISSKIKNKNKNNNENDLNQENMNLKENIKFLLGQIKKYQKSGIIIDETNKNDFNNENETIIKLKEIISEKEKEIENIKKFYQNEKKSMLEKASNLENQYRNLKKEYNELQNKFKNDNYKHKIELDNNNDITKLNNSKILEKKNINLNFEPNRNQPFYRNIVKYNMINSTYKLENSKNTEGNYYSSNNSENKLIFHRPNNTAYFSNGYLISNCDKDIGNTNNKISNYNGSEKHNYLKLDNDTSLSLNNSFMKENKNSYQLINNEKSSKTTKSNNISFLYKNNPIKTEIVNSLKNIYNSYDKNYRHSLEKNKFSCNYLEESKKSNYQFFKNCHNKNNIGKEDICPKLIRKLSSTLYRKKNNKRSNFQVQDIKKINNSYNHTQSNKDNYYTKEDEHQNYNILIPRPSISFSSVRFSKRNEPTKPPSFKLLPQIDLSPKDLYYFPLSSKSSITKDKVAKKIVYKFNIDNMKYSTIELSIDKNSSFNLSYSSTINHSNDIVQSISNGFFIITGNKTNSFYYYNKTTNNIYNLNNLNYSHKKGALLKIDNNRIICISGINSVNVEMYYIKDNIWLNLPKMNCSHSDSSYILFNNNIVFSFFGYDYDNKQYINNIEYLELKNYYYEEKWNKIIINSNNNFNFKLRNQSIFYRINKENNDAKDIFIVGGYNNSGRNNGLIQVFIEEDLSNNKQGFKINFKKYEENKVKVIGNNNIVLDKSKNMDNLFLFHNEFNQFYDEENNLFYSYNYDNKFNIHIIDNFTLKHTIYRNKIKNIK